MYAFIVLDAFIRTIPDPICAIHTTFWYMLIFSDHFHKLLTKIVYVRIWQLIYLNICVVVSLCRPSITSYMIIWSFCFISEWSMLQFKWVIAVIWSRAIIIIIMTHTHTIQKHIKIQPNKIFAIIWWYLTSLSMPLSKTNSPLYTLHCVHMTHKMGTNNTSS